MFDEDDDELEVGPSENYKKMLIHNSQGKTSIWKMEFWESEKKTIKGKNFMADS